jgi:hypothetical protein
VASAKLVMRVTFLVAILTASVISEAQSSDNTSFRTQARNDTFSVEVYKSTPLSTVVSVLCKQAKVTCTGVELLARDWVPPMVVDGKFKAVVGQLVEGTGVNIVYAYGTPTAGPKLSLLRRTRDVAGAVPTAGAATDDTERSSNGASETRMTVLGDSVVVAPAVPSSAGAGSASGDPQPTKEPAVPIDAQKMFAGGYATAATPSEFLPFPGPDGKPIPSKPVNAEFLPFPDQFGNPIPVKPATPGSPFPPAPGSQDPK